MSKRTTLECPCCGNDGAESDRHGRYRDGQLLICSCEGHVMCCSEEAPRVWTADDCDCAAWPTLADIRAGLAADECESIKAALDRGDWNQNRTARALECRQSSLAHIINRHPELRAEIDRRLGK